jgi:hypothetical protein
MGETETQVAATNRRRVMKDTVVTFCPLGPTATPVTCPQCGNTARTNMWWAQTPIQGRPLGLAVASSCDCGWRQKGW